MPMVNIALFDFCETLISKQTGDDFVLFALIAKKKWFRVLAFRLIRSRLFGYAQRMFRRLHADRKFLLLKLLDGYTESEVQLISKNYASFLQEFIIDPIFLELGNLKADGVKIYIVSGGYSSYIKYFMPDSIDCVIANEFQYTDGVFRGSLVGDDCMGVEKVRRVRMNHQNESVRYVAAYSDSSTDIPMLKMAECGVVVSRIRQQDWAINNGFKEIVWH